MGIAFALFESCNWGSFMLGFEASSILMLFGYGLGYKSLRGQFSISYLFCVTLVGSGAFCLGAYLLAYCTGCIDVSSIAAAGYCHRAECELSASLIVIAMGCKLPHFPVVH